MRKLLNYRYIALFVFVVFVSIARHGIYSLSAMSELSWISQGEPQCLNSQRLAVCDGPNARIPGDYHTNDSSRSICTRIAATSHLKSLNDDPYRARYCLQPPRDQQLIGRLDSYQRDLFLERVRKDILLHLLVAYVLMHALYWLMVKPSYRDWHHIDRLVGLGTIDVVTKSVLLYLIFIALLMSRLFDPFTDRQDMLFLITIVITFAVVSSVVYQRLAKLILHTTDSYTDPRLTGFVSMIIYIAALVVVMYAHGMIRGAL